MSDEDQKYWGIWFLGDEVEAEGWCCFEAGGAGESLGCLESPGAARSRMEGVVPLGEQWKYEIRELPRDSDCVALRRLIAAVRSAMSS